MFPCLNTALIAALANNGSVALAGNAKTKYTTANYNEHFYLITCSISTHIFDAQAILISMSVVSHEIPGLLAPSHLHLWLLCASDVRPFIVDKSWTDIGTKRIKSAGRTTCLILYRY